MNMGCVVEGVELVCVEVIVVCIIVDDCIEVEQMMKGFGVFWLICDCVGWCGGVCGYEVVYDLLVCLF